jgi:Rhs element Vgr protein
MSNEIAPNERLIPIPDTYNYTGLEISVNGKRIENPAYEIQSAFINREINVIPSLKIVILDGDVSKEKFAVSESADFIPGNKIELKIGRDGKLQSLFKGIIVRQALRAKGNGNSYLQIECKDETVQLTMGRKNKYFQDIKDSEALRTVLGAKTGTVEEGNVKHKELVQFYCTDWDFALSRAEMNGLVLLVQDGKVNVLKPKIASSPALVLLYGSTIEELDVEMDARTQWQQVSASSWNYAGQSLFQAQSSGSIISEAGNIAGSELAKAVSPADLQLRHSGLLSEPELKAWTDAFLLKSRLAKIRGRLKIKGTPLVKPGDTIELKGLGERFNGLVYVSGVRHEYQQGIWTTQLQFGVSPDWFHQKEHISETPAAGMLPCVQGLQIATVVQLENDPDDEHRILVRMPLVDNQEKGTWARMASLDAGNNRGYFFRPEIGDEVIVGFINNDPRFAVVLGMLHSSTNPAPETAKDENHIKMLLTRSKMKTTYDDENIIMRMETPAGNSMELSEKEKAITIKDQHGNSIKMEQAGITIKSQADIKMEAVGSFSLKAGTSFTLEGLSVSQKASTTMEVSGQASTKVSGSAILELQGGLVKIN